MVAYGRVSGEAGSLTDLCEDFGAVEGFHPPSLSLTEGVHPSKFRVCVSLPADDEAFRAGCVFGLSCRDIVEPMD